MSGLKLLTEHSDVDKTREKEFFLLKSLSNLDMFVATKAHRSVVK